MLPRPVFTVVGLNAFHTIVSQMLVAMKREMPEPRPYPFCRSSSKRRTIRPATKSCQEQSILFIIQRHLQSTVNMHPCYNYLAKISCTVSPTSDGERSLKAAPQPQLIKSWLSTGRPVLSMDLPSMGTKPSPPQACPQSPQASESHPELFKVNFHFSAKTRSLLCSAFWRLERLQEDMNVLSGLQKASEGDQNTTLVVFRSLKGYQNPQISLFMGVPGMELPQIMGH